MQSCRKFANIYLFGAHHITRHSCVYLIFISHVLFQPMSSLGDCESTRWQRSIVAIGRSIDTFNDFCIDSTVQFSKHEYRMHNTILFFNWSHIRVRRSITMQLHVLSMRKRIWSLSTIAATLSTYNQLLSPMRCQSSNVDTIATIGKWNAFANVS